VPNPGEKYRDGSLYREDHRRQTVRHQPRRSVSDDEIRALLRCDFGIQGSIGFQKLNKQQRNEIIKSLCNKGAGARQLSRITGISYGIIQRVKE
jgi:hypothetical protein